ncbi:hypothetical protein C6Q13_00070 [Burkholderia gladioli]|nr:hypothetical protein C6Q13_00070 [Burkholderia gladioli]
MAWPCALACPLPRRPGRLPALRSGPGSRASRRASLRESRPWRASIPDAFAPSRRCALRLLVGYAPAACGRTAGLAAGYAGRGRAGQMRPARCGCFGRGKRVVALHPFAPG